jgi:peptidoglycan glycosyltransferase
MRFFLHTIGRSFAPIAMAVFALALDSSAESAPSPDLDLTSLESDGGGLAARSKNDGQYEDLTIDRELQREVTKVLERSKAPAGAIVMSDVRTGRIIAWVSIGKEGDLVRKAKYPGASIFKVVTAAALLENRYAKPEEVVCYGGGESRLSAADVAPGCHSGDKRIRFGRALGMSINGVFARLALKHLSAEEESTMAGAFGVGKDVPFDLPSERSFVKLPDDPLGFARASAGFGDAKLTPLSALFIMQTVANKGERVRLHIREDARADGRDTDGRAISKGTADELVRMLEVTTRAGTSKKAFREMDGRPNISVAGKTGTLAFEHPKRLVSWFAGFAPSRNPEVAISVLLANDEKWWRKGNEVARDALDAYFALQRQREQAK